MVYDNNDDNQVKNIRGKALYFGTSQVAEMLSIPDSKVRYYSNVFDDILHIEISNKQRRYTQADIDKMKFMIELKEEGMTLNQIKEYCQEVDFQDSNEIQVKENNPLGIQALAKALLEQQAILMDNMKQDIIIAVVDEVSKRLDLQDAHFDDMKNGLSGEVAITVEDVVTRTMKESSDSLQNDITNNINNKFLNIEEKIINENKKSLDDIKEENRKEFEKLENSFKCITQDQLKSYQEQNQHQGLLDRIFGKKK